MTIKFYASKANATRAAKAAAAKADPNRVKFVVVQGEEGFGVKVITLHREPSLQWRNRSTVGMGAVVAAVWEFFNDNQGLSRKDLINQGVEEGFATNTLRTQYTKWSKA